MPKSKFLILICDLCSILKFALLRYRIRGNEYFKAKEYDNALKEYSRAIIYDSEQAARSYNNRAVTCEFLCFLIFAICFFTLPSLLLDIKLQNYLAAIKDCEACLKLEPENVKALLRLADANYAQGQRREVSSCT